MNIIDRVISATFPTWAMKRVQARLMMRAYEAAKPSRLHRLPQDRGSGDSVVARAGDNLRVQARHLEENHDLANGVLDVLVNNIVGVNIGVEPQIKTKQGNLEPKANTQLLNLFREWVLHPDVTGEYHWNKVCRLACRSWLRDGEVLLHILEGNIRGLQHNTLVPLSVELFESDYLPFDLNDDKKRLVQGVEKDRWGKPKAYHVFREHPGNDIILVNRDTRRINANNVIHLKVTKRIRQTRGVSIFASVLTRLDDIKQYEESERTAARVAAAMTGFIKKPLESLAGIDPTTSEVMERQFEMKPGMFFDNLRPGEELGVVQSNRPSALLPDFRNAMLRAVASGTSCSFSSISKDYNGTYSAQRQELVEQSVHYAVLRDEFIEQFIRPVWRRFVRMALTRGLITLPRTVDVATIDHADFRGPAIPWIDPQKEVRADTEAVLAGFKSRSQVIRERGGNPADVTEQIAAERQKDTEMELMFSSTQQAMPSLADPNEEDNVDPEEPAT